MSRWCAQDSWIIHGSSSKIARCCCCCTGLLGGGGGGSGGDWLGWRYWCWCTRDGRGRLVRAVIASGLCGELSESFLVLFGEVCLEEVPCLVGLFFVIPSRDGVGVDTSLLEGDERELDCSAVGDGFAAFGGSSAYAANAFPQLFEDFVGVPRFGELVAVGY
jgi:hypothetical protein